MQPAPRPAAVSEPASPARRRAERLPPFLIPVLVGIYLSAVTLFMVFVLHLSVSPERFVVLMLIAALAVGRGRLFLTDWIPFLVLFLSYEYLRGISTRAGMAVHYVDLIQLERIVAFGQVPTLLLQRAFYHPGVVSWYDIVATTLYFLHFAFPLAVGYFFWMEARGSFRRYSRALLAMSFAAFFFYLLVPVAPPWLAAQTGALPPVVKILDHTLPIFTDIPGIPYPLTVYHYFNANPVAAMPSMHAAYPFLAFLFAQRRFGWRAWPLLVYCVCVWLSVLYLGEHYLVDVIGGLLFAFAAFFGEIAATKWWRRRMKLQLSPQPQAEFATRA